MELDEAKSKAVDDLVRAAGSVARAFECGDHPTFDQIDKLKATLFPFLNFKICGHKIFEYCECDAEMAKWSQS
jgi:hypothetical protein